MDRDIAGVAWRLPIVWYAFLGGIAAGSYALSALAALLGGEEDGQATRVADCLAFPLVVVCGLLFFVDQSPTGRREATPWGMASLLAMGVLSLGSFLGALVEDGWLGLSGWSNRVAGLRRSSPGKLFAAAAGCTALAFGAATGVVRPSAWASPTWLGAVLVASAASTGASAVALLDCWRKADVTAAAAERLARAVACTIVLELALLTALALSLRGLAGLAFQRWPGMLIPLFVVPVGLVLPLVLRQSRGARGSVDAALLVLLGGFVLRAAVAGIPGSLPFE